MLNFTQYLVELRSHPELNPKVPAYEDLKKYKDDPDIYIQFTTEEKVGINPKSSYDTPMAICTYPLKDAWILHDIEKKGKIYGSFPFASDRPYIYILRGKNTPGFLDMDKYTQEDYRKDLKKLEAMFKTDDSIDQFNDIVTKAESSAKEKIPIMYLWNLTRLISKVSVFKKLLNLTGDHDGKNWNYLLRRLGYTGFLDHGHGWIHPGEPAQAMFLDSSGFKVIDKIKNNEKENIIWDGGTWEGTWHYGTWKNGIWEDGTWKDGTWKDGTWKNGIWYNGSWKKGTWNNGIWKNGIWESGTWKEGTWKKGTWKNGIWEDGTWENGIWKNGIWEEGYWYNGIWEDGYWKYGKFRSGTWKKGTWIDGRWDDGHWRDGLWLNGTWNSGTWKKGTWKNGMIYSNKFDEKVFSKVEPNIFYKLEKESSILEELKKKVS